MEDPRTTPSRTPVEAQGSFATGSDARSAAPGMQPGFAPQLLDSPGGSGGTGAAGAEPEKGAAGGPENQADGFGDSVRFECPHCGPVCYGGAAHNARVEGGVFYRAGHGNPPAAEPSDLRCRECLRFSRSLPRHASGCRYAGQNCPGCAYPGADHIAACPIAGQLKLPTDTCCDGVDIPAQGNLHAFDCRNLRPVLRASASYIPKQEKGGSTEDSAPKTTQQATLDGRPVTGRLAVSTPEQVPSAEDFPGMFGNLLFASRDLAMHWVLQPTGRVVKGFCLECGGTTGPDASDHSGTCRVGRVLDLVAKICAVSPALATMGGAR